MDSETTKYDYRLLGIILFVAAALRLSGLTAFSLSNDELSAINRLQYSSLQDVIRYGIYTDFHPAGVQLFLYFWTKLFGFSEIAVRLPFALLGIGSVLLLYKVGKFWFGESTALLAAASLAVLQFPLLYSQLARPYSPGLFFSLLTVYFWTKFFRNESKNRNWLYAIGFSLAVSGCMYTHYFSFIFAGLVCIAGIFFLRKNLILPYLVSGILIVIFYIPHFEIFFNQLGKGGVGGAEGWLGPPDSSTFKKYLQYCFNDSTQLAYLFIAMCAGSLLIYKGKYKFTKFHLLALVLFLAPFWIAYFYSIWKNPVLQFSVLLFSFPFLLLFIFSFFPEAITNSILRFYLFVIILGGAYSTVKEKQYYSTSHFSEFRGIANRIKDLDDTYGARNISKAISIHAPYYINYYLDKINHPVDFSIYRIISEDEVYEFSRVIDSVNTPYFIYAFSNVYDTPELEQMVRTKYPYLVLRDSMLNSGLRFYSKNLVEGALNVPPMFAYDYGFESNEWENELNFKDASLAKSGQLAIHLKTTDEYGPGLFKNLSQIKGLPGNRIALSASFYSKQTPLHAKLVFSIEKDGKSLFWSAGDCEKFVREPYRWSRVYLTVRVPNEIKTDCQVKIYCWNEKKEELWMDDFKMMVYSPAE